MKMNIKHIGLSLLLLIGILSACETTDHGEIGDPFSKLEGIKGSWEISKVISVDEGSVLKDEWDISKYYNTNPDSMLSVNFDINNMTYNVTPGNGRNYMGDSGDWYFDDPNYPSKLFLVPSTGDTIEMTMGSAVREFDPTMGLDFSKYNCEGTAIVTYKYVFNRMSN